eukprot:2928582-Pleurochrysis_carterae.AAC.1
MLDDIIADEKFNNLKYLFLKETLQNIYDTYWTCENIIGLMIDGGFSHRQAAVRNRAQLELMRSTFSMKYDADADRYHHFVVVTLGKNIIRMLEPVPPKSRWAPVWLRVKQQLKIHVSDDGSVASRGFYTTLVEMIANHAQLGMTEACAGKAAATPLDVAFMFDGFPVERISVTHWCIGNSSLRPELSS